MKLSVKPLLWPLLLIGVTLLMLVLAIRFSGTASIGQAFEEFWRGAFGMPRGLAATAAHSAILAFYALGIALSFRAGIVNIGAEGQSRLGAIVAAALGTGAIGASLSSVSLPGILLILLTGAIVGAAWSLLAGALRYWRGVPEVISTLMLNLIALLLAKYLLSSQRLLRGATIEPHSDPIVESLQLPGWGMTEFHAGIFLVLPAVLLCHVYLFHTRGGFSVRAVGLNSVAAETCGIRATSTGLFTFAIAGALAGLAGAMGTLARGRLDSGPNYPDYGFTAIAVALVSDLKPLWILPSAILFAGLEVGTRGMKNNADVPNEVVYLIEGLIIIAVLIRKRAGTFEVSTTAAEAAE